ncbi:MAG TPA: hypothetical protein VK843_08610 [Planctomycetota bacterium]|nr:hypothetical protein [Planctomycetota bacterium]
MIELMGLACLVCVSLGVLACIGLVARPNDPVSRVWALRAPFALWIFSFLPMLAESGDRVHLFWTAQLPLIGLFFLSGALLGIAFQSEPEPREPVAPPTLEQLVTPKRAPWWFLAMMASLGVLPLVLIAGSPWTSAGRDVGAPIRRLVDVEQWGLGGALPECLTPITPEESARGVGHLPREVTVPMGTILIATWLWISFCALALVGRMLPWPRIRRAFLLLSPPVLVASSFGPACHTEASSWWFDPRFFWGLSQHSGIWSSDPLVMRSLGPLLLIALASTAVLAILVRHKKAPGELPRDSV